jgi:uncharacterized membrane protein
MAFRSMIRASVVTTLLLAAFAAYALSRAPAGTMLPIHFDSAGQLGHYVHAAAALFWPVGGCAALSIFCAAMPEADARIRRSAALHQTGWACLLALMVLTELATAAPLFGLHIPIALLPAACGMMFILIGNALPKSRPARFLGIRTPWTLSDPENWVATHRLGARTMMAGGAILLVSALLPLDAAAHRACFFGALLIAMVPPVAYSYLFWRRHGRPA